MPYRGARGGHHAPPRFLDAVHRGPEKVHRFRIVRGAGLKLGVDPLGGAECTIGSRSRNATG